MDSMGFLSDSSPPFPLSGRSAIDTCARSGGRDSVALGIAESRVDGPPVVWGRCSSAGLAVGLTGGGAGRGGGVRGT